MRALLIGAPVLLAAGCALPVATAPTTPAPTVTVTRTAEPPTTGSDYGTRELLAAAFDQLPVTSQRQLCDIYRGSPSNAWSMWEATATGASATVTRADFMAVFGVKCS